MKTTYRYCHLTGKCTVVRSDKQPKKSGRKGKR